MTTESPTFSVVVPLYNHERYIEDALTSVLKQSRTPFDLVVVDDGSSDRSYEVAQACLRDVHFAKVVRQENCGAHHAINRAIQLSKGSHIAVLNSDDLFKPQKLERCSRLLTANPDISLLFGKVEIIDSDGRRVERSETTEWLDRAYSFLRQCDNLTLALLNENFGVTTSNFVFSRTLWETGGGFKNLRYCHDLDFLMAASRYGKLQFDNRAAPHIAYRVHPTNTIKETLDLVHLEVAAVIASALEGETLALKGSASDRERRVVEDILKHKGLSNRIASIIPYRRPFADRDSLYAQLSANSSHGTGANPPLPFSPSPSPSPSPLRAQASSTFKVAIELSSFDRGGLEKVVLDCAIEFKRCGIEPLIISCGEVGHLGMIAREHGIETIRLPNQGRDSFYEELLRTHKVDLAMSHFSYAGYRSFRKMGIPNITFIHNIYAMLRDKALADFLEADSAVDHYISVSSLATDYAVHNLGIDRAKITTVPNGLILEEHEARLAAAATFDRSRFGIKDTDYLFLNVASYNLHKSHYLMADAMRLILRKRDDIKILCVGNVIYAPHFDHFRAYLADWDLTDHILLPGYFEDVAPLHKASDAFLLPSLIEGWSIAMNEAMFYGKPMILTRTGGAPEVIQNNDIGLLIPNEYGEVTNLDSYVLDRIGYEQRRFQTAPYLASAMTQFADNRAYWKERGARGHEKVVKEFNFSDVTQRYITLCHDMLRCRT